MKGTEASINHTARRLCSSFIAQNCNFAFHAFEIPFFFTFFCEWTEFLLYLVMYSSLCLQFLTLTSMKFLVVLNDMNAIFCPRHKGVEWLTLPTNDSRDVLFVLNAIKINYLSAICLKRFWMEKSLLDTTWAAREQVFPIDEVVVDFPSHLVIWICLQELSRSNGGVVSGEWEVVFRWILWSVIEKRAASGSSYANIHGG